MYDDVLFSLREGFIRCSFYDDEDTARYQILRRRVWEYFYNLVRSDFLSKNNEFSHLMYDDEYADDDDVFGDLPEQILTILGCDIDRDCHGGYVSHSNRRNLEHFVCDAKSAWYRVYDFIEVVFRVLDGRSLHSFSVDINTILASCLSRYRFVDGYVVCVLSDSELQELSRSLCWNESVSQHMRDALGEYSKRVDANMSKVVGCAISAVEASIVSIVGGKPDTLGRAFDHYQKYCDVDLRLDSGLVNAIKSLYKYTCSGGIRHGGVDYKRLDELDGRFVLVLSSVLTNYLNERNQLMEDTVE